MPPKKQQEPVAAATPATTPFKLSPVRQRLFEAVNAEIQAQQAGSSQYALFDERAFNALCDRYKWQRIEDYKANLAQFSAAHTGRYEFVSESGDQFTYKLTIPAADQRLAAAAGFFDGDQITVFRNQLSDAATPPPALQVSVRKTTQSGLMIWVCTQTKVYGNSKYEQGKTYYKNFSLPYKVGKITVLS